MSALGPQGDGEALAIPVGTTSTAKAMGLAVSGGATVAGKGPGGTLLLTGVGGALGWRLLAKGILVVRVPGTTCSNFRTAPWKTSTRSA